MIVLPLTISMPLLRRAIVAAATSSLCASALADVRCDANDTLVLNDNFDYFHEIPTCAIANAYDANLTSSCLDSTFGFNSTKLSGACNTCFGDEMACVDTNCAVHCASTTPETFENSFCNACRRSFCKDDLDVCADGYDPFPIVLAPSTASPTLAPFTFGPTPSPYVPPPERTARVVGATLGMLVSFWAFAACVGYRKGYFSKVNTAVTTWKQGQNLNPVDMAELGILRHSIKLGLVDVEKMSAGSRISSASKGGGTGTKRTRSTKSYTSTKSNASYHDDVSDNDVSGRTSRASSWESRASEDGVLFSTSTMRRSRTSTRSAAESDDGKPAIPAEKPVRTSYGSQSTSTHTSRDGRSPASSMDSGRGTTNDGSSSIGAPAIVGALGVEVKRPKTRAAPMLMVSGASSASASSNAQQQTSTTRRKPKKPATRPDSDALPKT